MLKVFLIDDEQNILNGLQYIVDWHKAGFTLSGCYTVARIALQEALKIRPDLIITDIKMPGYSGLELISALRKELPDSKFIVISAYDSFEFAQQAIQYGAFRYLLKPIDQEALTAVLADVQTTLSQNRNSSLPSQEHQKKLLRSCFIRDTLLDGIGSFQEADILLQSLGSSDNFQLLFCHIPQCLDESDKYIPLPLSVSVELSSFLDRMLSPLDSFFYQGCRIMLLDSVLIKKDLEDLCGQMRKSLGIEAVLSATPAFKDFQRGHAVFREYFSAFQQLIFFGEKSVQSRMVLDLPAYLASIRQNLVAVFEQRNLPAIHQILDQVYQTLTQSREQNGLERTHVIPIYQEILRFGVQSCLQMEKGAENPALHVDFDYFQTHRDLNHFVEKILVNQYEEISRHFAAGKSNLIALAKLYIANHYSDPNLKLNTVTNYLFVNYSYLSHLFNSETGVSFSQYLSDIRLQKAGRLLLQSCLSISEISRRVGYCDTKNFFRAFKRQYGKSPQEYRKKSGV